MSSWYSPAGLRRGIAMAGLGAALMAAWAIGYHQGVARRAAQPGAQMIHLKLGTATAIHLRPS
jgi:hypothetical protein